jgi:hypothetical protein
MSKLDTFCNEGWDIHFDTHIMHALSSSLSDHYPLLLFNSVSPRMPRFFFFENFCVRIPRFADLVQEVWTAPNSAPGAPPYPLSQACEDGQSIKKWSGKSFQNPSCSLTWH